ncbi:MAG: O-methyltransferase [candidate division Zixibacteria bacterium]|nr:O-methyltransferase [candidate division Zixibacteria bacterium]
MFKKVHTYLSSITPERSPIMREMEGYARENNFPIVGPLVGRLLYQLATLNGARTILELGSGFGYSAYWFSLATKGRGHITMTDGDRTNKRRAIDYFKRAGLQSHFDYRVGDALRIARRLRGPFDIVFNDIDKDGYPDTIDVAARLLRKGGLFVTDNLIWSGRVCDKKKDATTAAVDTFNRALYQDSRFFTTIMPVRDGVGVAIRQ